MAHDHSTARYRHWYAYLLHFYPKPYREQFGEGMEQTFNDLCRERREAGYGLFGFVLWVFIETSAGIIRENLQYNHMKSIFTNPKLSALIGFLFVLPFLILNAIVGSQIEPFYSLLRPQGPQPVGEYALLIIPLLLLPFFGAFIAIRPMLQRAADGTRKMFLFNIIVAAILLIFSITVSTGLGMEIYRCEVLQIPNCD